MKLRNYLAKEIAILKRAGGQSIVVPKGEAERRRGARRAAKGTILKIEFIEEVMTLLINEARAVQEPLPLSRRALNDRPVRGWSL
ncbi:hypothetical protein COV04_03945 [Candidatus Uhrbacteria bacterium CG10_big_fil_rev_8_21_14_0_10_48_11]|uniref:Chorismate mutase domain-containing protein n=1 Tax=Candidatus Uhrbacteria bacterium CG10_big_fil_rev_8_21_14_0_10_48_11 TaxID=1975037 RepID=A0A2M8LDP6_9BACT|nr:MAG: hypothetical protein COV04_03945 [Candidatus Uhrbacteria bacterium CG10_big_fil_rev_8_21_14_0_10_48_11]